MKKFLGAGLIGALAVLLCCAACGEHTHLYGEWETATPATCTEAGKERRVCSECGEEETRRIAPAGHRSDESGYCTVCGLYSAVTKGLSYTLVRNNGAYEVSGMGTVTDRDIVVPYFYNGLVVTGIGDRAFYGCDFIERVSLPGGVTHIGRNVFYGCTALTRLEIAESDPVYFSAGNCLIERAGGTLVAGCGGSVIPSDGSVTGIGENAFAGAHALKSVSLPEGVTEIGSRAFLACHALTAVRIPGSVKKLGDWAFDGCISLASVTFGQGTEKIGEYAFYGCNALTELSLPEGLTEIGIGAFNWCVALARVEIPASMTAIGAYAFYECNALSEAVFRAPGGWQAFARESAAGTALSESELSDPAQAASCLTTAYFHCDWKRG